jgi:HTH-type transcriptional regulator/antitoxin HigA
LKRPSNRAPRAAESFPPGEVIKEELDARGWSQVELAEILGRPARLVNELLAGKRAITPETAKGLAAAFGTSAEFWMNLESHWQLAKVKVDDAVARRSRLYAKFPVKDMIRRGWISATKSLDQLEQEFQRFFDVPDLDAPVAQAGAFRRSITLPTPAQHAWVRRVRQLGASVHAKRYDPKHLDRCLADLRRLLVDAAEVRHVPRILGEAGIRLVIIEPLPGSKIDGVCLWLDDGSPVIGLSLRFDRIDWFWFTLFHELMHVKNQDGSATNPIIDTELVGNDDLEDSELPDYERRADHEAQEMLVSDRDLENFIARVRPLYSYDRVVGFAARLQIHPGIVVGQLQRRKEIPYSNLRKLLEKIRINILPSSFVDGWGHVPSIKG